MKYIVAIDWRASHRSGYSYVELKAKTIKDAMIEAPATAARFARDNENLEYNLDQVYGLRLLLQTQAQAVYADATDAGKLYIPSEHTWVEDTPVNEKWIYVHPHN